MPVNRRFLRVSDGTRTRDRLDHNHVAPACMGTAFASGRQILERGWCMDTCLSALGTLLRCRGEVPIPSPPAATSSAFNHAAAATPEERTTPTRSGSLRHWGPHQMRRGGGGESRRERTIRDLRTVALTSFEDAVSPRARQRQLGAASRSRIRRQRPPVTQATAQQSPHTGREAGSGLAPRVAGWVPPHHGARTPPPCSHLYGLRGARSAHHPGRGLGVDSRFSSSKAAAGPSPGSVLLSRESGSAGAQR
jgi:hypothetical protein